MNASRSRMISAALAAVLVAAFSVTSAEDYEITIENMIPGGVETGQPFTPSVVVVHGAGYSLFMEGGTATPGLEALAEDGVTADLVAEAEADPDVHSVVVGNGPFFDVDVIEVSGNPGDLVSLATMLARTNDFFTGIHDIPLPAEGAVELTEVTVWDCGTEENTGLIEHIPFYGNAFAGPEEEEVISPITEYSVLNDPDSGQIDYAFPPSATITIRLTGGTPTDSQTWGAVKSLFR